jgi:hypothetical protein
MGFFGVSMQTYFLRRSLSCCLHSRAMEPRGYPKTLERIVAHFGGRDKIAPLPIPEGIMPQRGFSNSL